MYSIAARAGVAGELYPEREERRLGKVDQWVATVGGVFASWLRPSPERFNSIVQTVKPYEEEIRGFSDGEILEAARSLKYELRSQGYQEGVVAKSFALVREVSGRHLGMRHMDVQLIGGLVMLNGMVAEMETGEGKTLTATLPACTLALGGVPVHIITVNDYLAQRDAEWMGPVYHALGLTVGVIQHGIDPATRRAAYQCDITYCTNKEVAFDYLRDRIVLWDRPTPVRLQIERLFGKDSRVQKLVMRGLHFAIVDEADSVLVDEARTPLIISSQGDGLYDTDIYRYALDIAKELVLNKDYSILPSERTVELTKKGKGRVAEFSWSDLGGLANVDQREELVRQALVALNLFERDKQYLVQDDKVQIIDEYTGRLMADRSWEGGLQQLIEIKEGCEMTSINETKARISYQRFFRRYRWLAGMTGTAREVAGELWSIYRMRVVTVPTNRPVKRYRLPDRVFTTAEDKWESVVKTISDTHQNRRPVLVGTRSVEASEHLSRLLEQAGLPHKVLNARQDKEEAEIIARAGEPGSIVVATNMAGRGTDIRLAPGVAERGGLHVIATERHEAGRIDRQLFGRCGRQGDPGSCEAMVSLDDELIIVYIGKVIRWLSTVAIKHPERVVAKWTGSMLFHKAQRTAERLHARMRHDLLKFDTSISESLAFTGRFE